ncbi:hypothetical protein [Sulfitobacter sp. R18_1]|uniref:hypothetical protein n=1 Tax=Sulfitobacter sp. R18_1 TaxID=2821104 RepID=UPI001ADBA702|nr:hypothetical protein [Sulfitobacter sp. R18_1]MBO9428604.1 hypothetical protein [Sulfitobacter sp. R18_1]
MSKEITLSQQQKTDLISQVLKAPALPSSAQSITGRYTDEESRNFLDNVIADIGPDVMEAASGVTMNVVDQYLEANGIDKEGFWEDYYESRENGEEPGVVVDYEAPLEPAEASAPRLSKQDRIEVSSTAMVAAALNQSRDMIAPLNNVKLHSFATVAQAPGARMMARNIFGLFPCFRALGSNAVDRMDVAMHIEARPGGNDPQARAMVQRIGPARMTGREDVQGIGRWIKEHGMSLAANRVQIPTGLQKYESNVLFAVSDDETFLFVEERADLASYSFNDETGQLTARVKPGKEIQSGEIIAYIPINGGGETAVDNFDRIPRINGDMELRPVVGRPNELALCYTGEEVLEQHDVVTANFNRSDLVPEVRAMREKVKSFFDPIGNFGGHSGGGSPVDAQFVYRWPGGRKYFESNPEAVQQLSQLMAARDTIEITMNLQEDMRRMGLLESKKEAKVAAISSKTADTQEVEQVKPDLPPVTPPAPRVSKNMNNSKPVKLMSFLRERGYLPRQYKVGAGRQMVLFKQKGDEFLVMSAADGRPLPSSREMNVELRDSPEDEAGKTILATISNAMSPEEIMNAIGNFEPEGTANTP